MAVSTGTAILASAGLGVGGSLLGARASRKSAEAMEDAADQSAATQRYMYDTSREDFAPYREAGVNALSNLQGMLSGDYDFTKTPGYEFMRNEGLRGIERSAAARGGLQSGGTLRALARYNSGLASQEFGNRFNRLASIAGVGQSATGSTATLGANAAGNIGNAMMQGGNARASGIMGQNNALQGGLSNLSYLAGQYGGGASQPSQYSLYGNSVYTG